MSVSPIRELAQNEAVATVLCDIEGVTYDSLLDDLREAEVSVPEEYIVWAPFEDLSAESLARVLEGFATQFERFAHATLRLTRV